MPSTSRYAVSGSAASQARTRRGTKGARDRVVVLEGTIAWLQRGTVGPCEAILPQTLYIVTE